MSYTVSYNRVDPHNDGSLCSHRYSSKGWMMKVNRSLYQNGRYQEIIEQLSSAQGQTAGEYMAAVKKRAVIYNSSKVRTESPEAFITDMVNNDLIQLS